MSNEVRHSDKLLSETPNDSGYAKQTVNSYDDRFTSDWSTVCERLAFSSAQADVGLFEPGLRDERYLPFEGIGAISSWKLDLSSSDLKLFDYLSIADVVLTIRYTATMGSDKFKKAASASVLDMLNAIDRGQGKCGGMCTSFDLRRDFSAEWQRFAATPPVGGRHKMTARLNSEKFPLFARPKGVWIHAVWIEPCLKNSEGDASRVNDLRSMVKITMPGGAEASSVESQPLLVGTDPSACEWTLTVSEDKAVDFFAAVDSVILLCVFRIGAPST